MTNKPYFNVDRTSFEKNAGYKSTVHALAELIDNSYEADAKKATILLVVDRDNRLKKIAVVDDGKGMSPAVLQDAVREKSGENLDRQIGPGKNSRGKFGKYGVGLPRASISQCNKFTVWSWHENSFKDAYANGLDIDDDDWIKKGAIIAESYRSTPPREIIEICNLTSKKSGSVVLWENLDGLTWQRSRWGENSGLIPNLEFYFGRVYRKMLDGISGEFKIDILTTDEKYKPKENISIAPNDPLYLTKGQKIPRENNGGKLWPPDDPMFEESTPRDARVKIESSAHNGLRYSVEVKYRTSMARHDVFRKMANKANAGSLPHGKHAVRNAGVSLLREGREVDLNNSLLTSGNPRERWIGLEFDFPQELDSILGMTNNKQSYVRLEQVLKHSKEDYMDKDETTDQCLRRLDREDPQLAICLIIAWKIQDVWAETLAAHLRMREDLPGKADTSDDNGVVDSPKGKAETAATDADKALSGRNLKDDKTRRDNMEKFRDELINGGVPPQEAKELAERIVRQGLTYAIVEKANLGSPFFSVGVVVDAKMIELNQSHSAHPLLMDSLSADLPDDPKKLKSKLENSRTAFMLMLEAWAKLEAQAIPEERRRLQRLREDWGRTLEDFIQQLRTIT